MCQREVDRHFDCLADRHVGSVDVVCVAVSGLVAHLAGCPVRSFERFDVHWLLGSDEGGLSACCRDVLPRDVLAVRARDGDVVEPHTLVAPVPINGVADERTPLAGYDHKSPVRDGRKRISVYLDLLVLGAVCNDRDVNARLRCVLERECEANRLTGLHGSHDRRGAVVPRADSALFVDEQPRVSIEMDRESVAAPASADADEFIVLKRLVVELRTQARGTGLRSDEHRVGDCDAARGRLRVGLVRTADQRGEAQAGRN